MSAIDKNVDPELWPLVEAFPPIELNADTLPGFRGAMVQLSVVPDPASHADVNVQEVTVPGGGKAAPGIRCLLFRPTRSLSLAPAQRAPAPALLHIHGGGFVMGMPEMDLARNIELVRATGCTILSVDYRLAPEHPHPAGLEDCHAALVWLAANAGELGISPERIGVIGESAGGGLAAALALLARERNSMALARGAGGESPAGLACQVLIYPMLIPPARSIDASTSSPHTGRYIWTRASNAYCWSACLSGEPANPSTIAGLAPDLSGLPPAFIAVGAVDLFVHDNLAYASRLIAAGCVAEAHVYPGAIHGFDRAVEAGVTARFTRDLVGFIRARLGANPASGG